MLKFIYSSNFNGWNIIDSDNNESEDYSILLNELVEFTSNFCDEDGCFYHNFNCSLFKAKLKQLIEKRLGYIKYELIEDDQST